MAGLSDDDVVDLTMSETKKPGASMSRLGPSTSSPPSPAMGSRDRATTPVALDCGSSSSDDEFDLNRVWNSTRGRLTQSASTSTSAAAVDAASNDVKSKAVTALVDRHHSQRGTNSDRAKGVASRRDSGGKLAGKGKGEGEDWGEGGLAGEQEEEEEGGDGCDDDDDDAGFLALSQEASEYEVAGTQESEVVDLLSDSDDDEGGVAPGRSQLWSNRARGGGPGAAAASATARRIAQTGRFGDSDNASEQQEEEEEIESLGLDDFGSLMLASQTSTTTSSPPRGTRQARGGDGRRDDDADALGLAGATDDDSDGDEECSLPSGVRSSVGVGGGDTQDSGAGEDAAMSKKDKAREETATSKKDKALARKEATANRKRQREEAAAAAKQQRERERLARKEEKERSKKAEKAEKAAKTAMEQQARGKFSHLEVACVMERGYFDGPESVCVRNGAAKQPGGTEEFMVAAGDCGASGAVWWTRRAHLDGGAAAAGSGVETLDLLAVVVGPEKLLDKLGWAAAAVRAGKGIRDDRGTDDGDSFSELGRFVDGIRACTPGFGRLILVLEGVEQELHRRWQRSGSGGGGSTASCPLDDDLEDALCWLLVHKDVETRVTKDGDETGQYLWDLTRALSAMPYKDDVTELHCVHRLKSKARGSENLPTKEEQDLADTWVRMLQQVPGVSESMSIEIASKYSLPRTLAGALSDPALPESQRASLLADKMGTKNKQGKRARYIFDLFTQEDGDFVLS